MDMREKRLRTISKWLGIFLMPGQVSELRALHVGSKKAICGIYSDTAKMAEAALGFEDQQAKGIYFTPNPLKPEMLESNRSARKDDVLARSWLLVDVDPIRPTDCASTLDERNAAWEVLRRVRGSLEAAGMIGVVIGDSGNGFHINFPIDLPNDDATHEKIKKILQGLQKRCSDPKAEIDTCTHDAPRIWKVPGLMTRKGIATEERPHRWASLVEFTLPTKEIRQRNNEAINRCLMLWDREESLYKRQNYGDSQAYAKAALAKEVYAVANCQHHRNDRLNEAAFSLGQLIACGALNESEVEEQLYDAACRCGLDKDSNCGPSGIRSTIRSGFRSGKEKPRDLDEKLKPEAKPAEAKAEPKESPKNADNSSEPEDQDATAADLIAMNATIRWAWPLWIPQGLLCALAAEPGCGKTRLCLDLARRIYHGLPWPDGSPPTFPPGSVTMWVPADNQHAELATCCTEFGIPPSALYLNATKKNPFSGTMLDALSDLREFEARIKRIKPAIVFVDTTLNSTDRGSSKPEDAKQFFVPLAQICQRLQCSMMMVTHLNAGGTALGRRIEGQCRVVVHIDKPDPDQEFRRALWVKKSNCLMPPKLGVTMGDGGNQYDTTPPINPDEGPSAKQSSVKKTKIDEAAEWLKEMLQYGTKRVSAIRTESDALGRDPKNLYAAKDRLDIIETIEDGKKWWTLPPIQTTDDGEILI